MTRLLLAAALALIGCTTANGANGAKPASTPADASPTVVANDLPKNPAGCPAAFGGESNCNPDPGYCQYPEGYCRCEMNARVECRGTPVTEEESAHYLAAGASLRCHRNGALRGDGCPEEEPNGACTSEGKSCMYGDCGGNEYTCTGGSWQLSRQISPPP